MRAIDINQIVIVRDVEPTFRGHLPCRGLRGAAVYWSWGGVEGRGGVKRG